MTLMQQTYMYNIPIQTTYMNKRFPPNPCGSARENNVMHISFVSQQHKTEFIFMASSKHDVGMNITALLVAIAACSVW